MNVFDCKAICAERFKIGDRRSPVYQWGFRDALELKLNGTPRPALRWTEGSVEFDAYFAGWDGGVLWASILQDKAKESGQ